MNPAEPDIESAPSLYTSEIADMAAKLGASLTVEHLSLRDFFKAAWPVVNPNVSYIQNWHNDLIAEYLEAVHFGQIRKLAINMPPRFGKSFHVTVAFPCWEWTEDPTERFLFSSHNQKLCNRHSLDRRAVITSAWYRNRWGLYVNLADDQNLKTEFQNTARGHMITAPVGGSATGSGGRRLVLDDAMNPRQAGSKIQRESTIDYIEKTLMSRLDDEAQSAIILVEQRLHKDDPTGKLVAPHYDGDGKLTMIRDGWVHLKIPIEAKRTTSYIYPRSLKEKVFENGEPLCAARKSKAGIKALRAEMGEREALAQLDQEPSEVEGKMFKRAFWRPLRESPAALFTLNVWDTAVKTNQENDYSVGLCLIKHAGGIHVCAMTRDQMAYPSLVRAVLGRNSTDHPDAILIEDKSSGSQVTQQLQEETNLAVVNPDPDFQKLDKVSRAQLVLPQWEAGRISYDPDMEGAEDMLSEFAGFPGGAHDDIVDAAVHGVRYLLQLDKMQSPEEHVEREEHGLDEGLELDGMRQNE